MSFFVGLDLGQVNDYTALAIAERIEPRVKPLSAYPWHPGPLMYERSKGLVSTPQPTPPKPKPIVPLTPPAEVSPEDLVPLDCGARQSVSLAART